MKTEEFARVFLNAYNKLAGMGAGAGRRGGEMEVEAAFPHIRH